MEITITNNFSPKPEYNTCDHCISMDKVKDCEFPCRHCVNNANANYFKMIDDKRRV